MTDPRMDEAARFLAVARRVVALTGAGISAESGVPTFRGRDGLWKTYRAEELATPEAFERDPSLVWEWYDWRRGLIAKVEPNPGHQVLARWERVFESFHVITQNVDGLHGRAGSRNLVELHGNIWKVRCVKEGTVEEAPTSPLSQRPPICRRCGSLLRPHVVWFGEALDTELLERARRLCETSEVALVIGTSAVVQPAASLPYAASRAGAKVIEINLEPTSLTSSADVFLAGPAGEVLPALEARLAGERRA